MKTFLMLSVLITAGKTALDLAIANKVESYMPTSVKDTRFDKEKVIEVLMAAMK